MTARLLHLDDAPGVGRSTLARERDASEPVTAAAIRAIAAEAPA